MAFEHEIAFTQGDNYSFTIPLWADAGKTVPFDFDGYEARMQVRRSVKTPVLVELSTDNGRITFSTLNGASYLTITFGPEDSRLIPADTECGYDLEISNGSNWFRTILEGTVNLKGDFTRG